MQRIRKDSETLSNSGLSTASRIRRESDRLRSEIPGLDNASSVTHRSIVNSTANREVIKEE